MTIYIDADACPVVSETEKIARNHNIPLVLICDTNHALSSDYAEVVITDAGADAVDIALVNRCAPGDIVITQDYGVAAMALGKRAYALHQSGMRYTDENIGSLLAQRHMSRELRRTSAKNHIKGPRKRVKADDMRFSESLERLISLAKTGSYN